MQMKKVAVIFALMCVMIGVVAVSAQDGRPGRPEGPRGARLAGLHMLIDASSEATGLERADLLAQMRDGATLGEVITANGGDVDVVLADALAAAVEAINVRIENGSMTQEQGDDLLARAEAGFQTALDAEFPQHPGWRPRVRIARQVVDLAAEQTGLEPQAIVEQLRAGSSLGDILSANGVDPTAFVDDVIAEAETRVNARLEHLRERLTEQINQAIGEA
jgi:hypothetical protein